MPVPHPPSARADGSPSPALRARASSCRYATFMLTGHDNEFTYFTAV